MHNTFRSIKKYFRKKKIIVTHSGNFHSDDIFAVATLCLVLEKDYRIKIIRTRDSKIIEKADFVVDVGMVYDKDKNRFDHHQGEGAGFRENGIPYASFGLVWEKYGEGLSGSKEVAMGVDSIVAWPIDARDNGIDLEKIDNKWGISDYTFFKMTWVFRSKYREGEKELHQNFVYLVSVAKKVIEKSIDFIKDTLESQKEIETAYSKTNDKRLLIIDKPYLFEEYVSINKDILLVISPKVSDNTWGIECARDEKMSFKNRVYFPYDWCGKRDKELEEVTGVKGSIFCHKGGFFFVADSKETAFKIAKKVIPDLNI